MYEAVNYNKMVRFVFVRTAVAFPILLIAFYIWGLKNEHGDNNAAGMYPLVFAVHGIILSVVSYAVYYLTDKIIQNKKINPIKNAVHLIIIIGLVLFGAPKVFVKVGIISVSVIFLINLIAACAQLMKTLL